MASVHTLGCDARALGQKSQHRSAVQQLPRRSRGLARRADKQGLAVGRFLAWSVEDLPPCRACSAGSGRLCLTQ